MCARSRARRAIVTVVAEIDKIGQKNFSAFFNGRQRKALFGVGGARRGERDEVWRNGDDEMFDDRARTRSTHHPRGQNYN